MGPPPSGRAWSIGPGLSGFVPGGQANAGPTGGTTAGLSLLAGIAWGAGEKGSQKAYALISGTVFRDSGLSLRGAELQLAPDGVTAKSLKVKRIQTYSDARGEFAIRVPALAGRYTLIVKARGYQTQERPVAVWGEEQIPLVF